MAASPVYADTPNVGSVDVTTANTNRDGTGTITTVLTAGASGSRIDRVDASAIVTTTAGMVRLFIHDGSSNRLFEELTVEAITVSASVAGWSESSVKITPEKPLILPTGYSLRASTHNAESFVVTAAGGDF